MSSSIPPKGSDVANEKLREMGAGMTIGPPIAGKQISK
jgi:hypothetical protein